MFKINDEHFNVVMKAVLVLASKNRLKEADELTKTVLPFRGNDNQWMLDWEENARRAQQISTE